MKESYLKPSPGDVIATDHFGLYPGVSWYSSYVIENIGDNYRVSYDDGRNWYRFEKFATPFYGRIRGTLIYPAIPPGYEGEEDE